MNDTITPTEYYSLPEDEKPLWRTHLPMHLFDGEEVGQTYTKIMIPLADVIKVLKDIDGKDGQSDDWYRGYFYATYEAIKILTP